MDFPRLWPVVKQEGQHAALGHAVSCYARLLKKLRKCVRGSLHTAHKSSALDKTGAFTSRDAACLIDSPASTC